MREEQQTTELTRLPAPSTSFVSEPELYFDGATVTVRWRFDKSGEEFPGELKFHGVSDMNFSTERHSSAWHLNAYDKVVEVESSSWMDQAKVTEISRATGGRVMRHFMVYLDSWGSLQVLAAACFLDDKLIS